VKFDAEQSEAAELPGIATGLAVALASLFTGRPVNGDIGMTGEITLRGRVLPVGGIKTKILAAHRAVLKMVILPQKNRSDLDDLPDDVRNEISFVAAERIDEALDVFLIEGQ
jgi:ATP-dependent Lon protease